MTASRIVGRLVTVTATIEWERLSEGHGLVEGPRGMADGGVLFSDVTGGGVYRWTPDDTVETVVSRRRGVGGLVPHADGGVVVAGRDLAHVAPDGTTRTLLAPEGSTGINDVHAMADGSVLAGVLRYRPMADEDVVPGEVLRLAPDGAVTTMIEGIDWPNGIGLSPDEGTLYVSDFARSCVWAIGTDGSDPRLVIESPRGSCDGLAVDGAGALWVALGPGAGIAHVRPDGTLLDVIDVPGAFVASVAFHGPHLLVATFGALLRCPAPAEGQPTPIAAV
jgi:gluconolactonase